MSISTINRHVLILSFLFLALPLAGQNILVLTDNERVNFSKYRIERGKMIVNTPDKQTQEFYPNDITGYYDTWKEIFFSLINRSASPIPDYDFVERKVSGEFSVYEETLTGIARPTQISGNDFTPTVLYGGKGNDYDLLWISADDESTKRQIQFLKSKIWDNLALVAMIENPEFKWTRDSVIKLIAEYNYSKQLPSDKSLRKGPVLFYLHTSRFSNLTLTASMVIGDSTEYFISSKKALPIDLPLYRFVKVCFTSGGITKCNYIQANPFTVSYVEANVNISTMEALKIETVTIKRAINFLKIRKRPY